MNKKQKKQTFWTILFIILLSSFFLIDMNTLFSTVASIGDDTQIGCKFVKEYEQGICDNYTDCDIITYNEKQVACINGEEQFLFTESELTEKGGEPDAFSQSS